MKRVLLLDIILVNLLFLAGCATQKEWELVDTPYPDTSLIPMAQDPSTLPKVNYGTDGEVRIYHYQH